MLAVQPRPEPHRLAALVAARRRYARHRPEQTLLYRMVEEVGGFRVVARTPYWMFPGYAEEIFKPVGS